MWDLCRKIPTPDPQSPWLQRGLALADLGWTVDHLGSTPANLSPPCSFAVSWDLKALWPGGLGCWGIGGRCPNMALKAPGSIYTIWAHLVDRGLAVLVSRSAGDFSCSHSVLVCDGPFCSFLSSYQMVKRTWWSGWVGGSLCTGVGVSVDTVFYRIIRTVAIGTHSEGSYSILMCADRRSQEYAIAEMPSSVFMK